ncbi:MAG TPA: hypothetical protein VIC06_10560 [Solirubrobacteraceae bacterium]|jgi:hypothetical protein
MTRAYVLGAVKACLLGSALLIFAGAPGLAQAEETTKLTVAFKPYRLGSYTTVTSTLTFSTTNGELPIPITHFALRFPASLIFSTSSLGLAVCHPEDLEAKGIEGCSPNAQIGTGRAVAELPIGPELVQEEAKVAILKGPPVNGQAGILIYSVGKTPVSAETLFQGEVLESASFGELLETAVPLIPSLPGAGDVVVTQIQMSVGPAGLTYYLHEHGKTVPYHPRGLQVPETCPRGGFRFGLSVVLANGIVVPANDTIPCPTSHHHKHHRVGR